MPETFPKSRFQCIIVVFVIVFIAMLILLLLLFCYYMYQTEHLIPRFEADTNKLLNVLITKLDIMLRN